MFKKISIILALCFTASAETGQVSPESWLESEGQISPESWLTNEGEAATLAHERHLPLVVAFLGEGWCPWSEKLAGDILRTSGFIQALEGRAVLLRIPMKQEPSRLMDEVREKYQVYHCPQVVVYDADAEEIGRLDYMPVTDVQYADQIVGLVEKFHEVKVFLENPSSFCEESRLQQLYESAESLSSPVYKERLLQLGIEQAQGPFFLLEKYAALLRDFKFKHPLVQEMRKKIVALDPEGEQGITLKLAVLEFQKLAETLKKKNHPEKALAPLLAYVDKFGSKDRENLWKIERMIADYLFTKHRNKEALVHAQASLAAAPEEMREEISAWIGSQK